MATIALCSTRRRRVDVGGTPFVPTPSGGYGAQGGSKATRYFARRERSHAQHAYQCEHGEHPPFGATEHRGTGFVGLDSTAYRIDNDPNITYNMYHLYNGGRMEMITISSAEFQRNFGAYQDKALIEPVAITRNGRERLVVVSADEYRRLKRRAREVMPVEALSDADLDAIGRTDMAAHHRHLDLELE